MTLLLRMGLVSVNFFLFVLTLSEAVVVFRRTGIDEPWVFWLEIAGVVVWALIALYYWFKEYPRSALLCASVTIIALAGLYFEPFVVFTTTASVFGTGLVAYQALNMLPFGWRNCAIPEKD
jgi:hypothetical protein